MISCDQALELISARLDAPLSPEEERELQAHLAQCADCRALLADFNEMETVFPTLNAPVPEGLCQSVLEQIHAEKVVPLPTRPASRRWKQWAASAAVFAVVLLGVGTFGLDQLADRASSGMTTGAAVQDNQSAQGGAAELEPNTSLTPNTGAAKEIAPPQGSGSTGNTGADESATQSEAETTSPQTGNTASPTEDGDKSGSASVQNSLPPDTPTANTETPAVTQAPQTTPPPQNSLDTFGVEPAGLPYTANRQGELTLEQAYEAVFAALGGNERYPDAVLEEGILSGSGTEEALTLRSTGLSGNGKYYTFCLEQNGETINEYAVSLQDGTVLTCRDESLLEGLTPQNPAWADAQRAYEEGQQRYYDTINNP